MNLTTIRRSEAEIEQLIRGGRLECLTVDVKDRFGSYGLVGVMLFETGGGSLSVDTFLLSCRALGRGVEHRMLAALGRTALERGLETVEVRFAPTSRNQPALDFLRGAGARFEQNGRFLLPAEFAAGITYNPKAKPAAVVPSPKREAGGGAESSTDLARIARELRNAEQILAAARAQARAPLPSPAEYTPPRTPLESRLAEIWAEMLGVARVGIHDNFFDIGGHSLLAVQLLSRVRETYQVDLSLNVVFTGAFTVEELAKAMEIHQIEQAGSDQYTAMLKELEGLSDAEVRALLAEEGGAASA